MSTSLAYPFADPPASGASIDVAPGVRWLRMVLPFALDHINLWLLADHDGWTLVDTGLGNKATRAVWEEALERLLDGRPLRRIIVTHYHPDHAGSAAWLCERTGATLWMTRAEFLTVHAVRGQAAGYTPGEAASLYHLNGLEPERVSALMKRGDLYRSLVPEFPHSHRRLVEGASIEIDGRAWQVLIGHGHAPEHASLHCAEANLLISGDMLLPRISTNIAVRPIDPGGNPLALFLESIGRYRALDAGVLVLPSHGLPFRGAHERVAQLEAHHAERLEDLFRACAAKPRSAVDILPVLFRRALGDDQIFFAMGEAIAHLHYLYHAGRLARSVGVDGVARFALPPDADAHPVSN